MSKLTKISITSVGISALILLVSLFLPLFVFGDDASGLMQISAGPIVITLLLTSIYFFVLLKCSNQNIEPTKAKSIWSIILLIADALLLFQYWNFSNCNMPNTFSGCAFALLGFAIMIVAPIFILQSILYLWFSISLSRKLEPKE